MKPVISLHGNGEDVVLSNRAARFVLMRGATGLGWSPRDLAVADLASGGGVLRHVRATTPKVMIPLLLGGGYGERREDRRTLERLCDGRVEIRVVHPDGQVRSRFGWLESGLQGDYGAGEDAPDGQKLALTFVCPDPMWYGQMRVHEQRVAAARKAFITGASPKLLRVNLAENPDFSSFHNVLRFPSSQSHSRSLTDAGGFDGGSGLILTATDTDGGGIRTGLSSASSLPPDSLFAGRVMVRASATMRVEARIIRRDTLTEGWAYSGAPAVVEAPSGEWAAVEARTDAARTAYRVGLDLKITSPDGGPVPTEESVTLSQLIIEAGTEAGVFFSGDTPDTGDTEYWWESVPGRSPSIADGRGASHAYPFFPVLLSDSTVQGAYVLHIQGDAEAWPVWEVTGPGEDLLIQNDDTGERIFIEGQFGEKVTITTRPQEQDITSESEMRGSLWSRLSDDSVLFPLKPGINKVRMSMVNGKPESTVTLRYREAFKAGV